MEKIKRFIDCYIPTENCNFKCSYCYISTLDEFHHKTIEIEKSPEFIRKALSKERLGGTCMLNFCAGGETLLSKRIVPIVEELLKEGHYVMIVTNGSLSMRFDEILKFDKELFKRLFIKFSYHYLELQRLNLLDTFFDNVKKMKNANISFTVEITPSDEYVPHIEEMKRICKNAVGAIPHVTVARIENGDIPIMTNLDKEHYLKVWKSFDSKLFDFKYKIFNEKRKEFCYAGSWSYILNLASGELKQCYRGRVIQNIYENLSEDIKSKPVGCYCPEPHCFNGHAFLAFGVIPELESPTFAEERDRDCEDGTKWLQDDMREFMNTKLKDSNNELSPKEKDRINRKNRRLCFMKKIKRKIKGLLKIVKKKK